MNDRPQRYGRPQVHEDPVKDAVEAHQSSLEMELRAIRSMADHLDENLHMSFDADQLRHACTVLSEASDELGTRVFEVRKTEEVSA